MREIRILAAITAVMFVTGVWAEPTQSATNSVSATSAETELAEEETQIFECGFDLDFATAYVWRNAVQNDEPVIQPGVWADLTYFEPFWLGFSFWQDYDLTRRRHSVYDCALTENDYNAHLGATAWEHAEMSLDLELGYDWCDYTFVAPKARESNPDTQELYIRAAFDNPFINVYGQVSWMLCDFGEYKRGLHYEIGFNREYAIIDCLKIGADWNVNFGDSHYLYYLYGGVNHEEDALGNETWSNPDAGIGGTTVKCYLTWNITDWMSLGATIAYTGVLNGSARQELANGAAWQGDCYRRDLLWGMVSLKFSY